MNENNIKDITQASHSYITSEIRNQTTLIRFINSLNKV